MVGLLAAAALAVDGGGADVFGQTGRQPGHPADVVGLLPELGHATADDLFDVTGVKAGLDAGLVDHRLCTAPNNSVACSPDSHPLRLPMGLRVASTMTG